MKSINYIISSREYTIPKDKIYMKLKEGFNGTILEFEIETKYAYKKVQFLPASSLSSEKMQEIANKINKFYKLSTNLD